MSQSSPVRRAARIVLPAIVLALGIQLTPVVGGSLGPSEARAGTICGNHDPLWGVDVSKYQGDIDWRAVQGSGISFGIARIADGLTYPDRYFQQNYAGMRANGITPGSYIFWEPAQDPEAQAWVVINALNSVGFDVGDLPPTLDVEVTGGQSPQTIAQRLRITANTIEQALGVKPFIYAAPGFWNSALGGADFTDLKLWVAHWGVACPNAPGGWGGWYLWQQTSSASIPGIPGRVDLNQTAGRSLPIYTGEPLFPPLPDIEAYGAVPTPVTFKARAVGYRGIGMNATCSPGSGSLFPVGETVVACTARNLFGSVTRSFKVTVRPPAAPTFSSPLPGDMTVDATGPAGTSLSLPAITAVDYAGGQLPVTCRPGPNLMLPIGESLVMCRATDSFGQEVSGWFSVTVNDPTRANAELHRHGEGKPPRPAARAR